MATATSFTAARMLEIEETTVVTGLVDVNGDLLLTNRRGEEFNAGSVRGEQGPPGEDGSPGTMPVGSIIDYPKDSPIPSYALLCDGSSVSRSIYGSLFGVIGTKFGTGDGSTTFGIPNLIGGNAKPIFLTNTATSYTISTGVVSFSGPPIKDEGFSSWNGTTLGIKRAGLYNLGFNLLVEQNNIMFSRFERLPLGGSWAEISPVVLNSNGRSMSITTQVWLNEGDLIRLHITLSANATVSGGIRQQFYANYAGPSGSGEGLDTIPIIIATDQGLGVTIVDGAGGYKLGTISLWPGDGPIPSNHLELNGQVVDASVYSGLAALFPSWVTGPLQLTLPDWRTRTAVGYLSGDPDYGVIGSKIGSKTHEHGSSKLIAMLWQGYHMIRYGGFRNATNSNNFTIPGASSTSFQGGIAVEGVTDTASTIQPSVVARWIICVADSAGEYSPTVQTAMVSSIIDLNSKTKKITAVARRNGSAYTHPTGNWVLFTNSIMSETENVGIPSGFLAPGYWLIPENGIYAVQISLFLPTTANIILVLKKNNTVAGDGGAFAGNSNVGTSSWSANTVYAEETFIAGDTVSAALFASGYGGSVNVTPSSALTQFRLRKISS